MADQLLTPTQAAELLGISTKTLREHVRSGEIAVISTGCGMKRPRVAYAASDIQDFINRRRTRLCQSTNTKTARSTNTTFNSGVIAFAALQERRAEERRNKSSAKSVRRQKQL